MNKITFALIITLLSTLVGCTKPTPPIEHQRYTTQGHYYTDGTVITSDGNVWGYATDTISNKPSFNNQAVYVAFDDNGTPNNIYDDVILGLVWDIETTIYDRLEENLSDKFELEREGNNIKIIGGNTNEN